MLCVWANTASRALAHHTAPVTPVDLWSFSAPVAYRACRLPHLSLTAPVASSCRAWFSHDRAPIAFSFSTSDRFGYVERALKKNATPGPGSYVA